MPQILECQTGILRVLGSIPTGGNFLRNIFLTSNICKSSTPVLLILCILIKLHWSSPSEVLVAIASFQTLILSLGSVLYITQHPIESNTHLNYPRLAINAKVPQATLSSDRAGTEVYQFMKIYCHKRSHHMHVISPNECLLSIMIIQIFILFSIHWMIIVRARIHS